MYPVYPGVNPWPRQVELRLAGLENRLFALAAENAEQENRLLALAAENAEQENRLLALAAENAEQESRLLALAAENAEQESRLLALAAENAELRATLAAEPSPQPAHITYKIQELHVNELKGTLNIGLTAQAGQEELNHLVAPLVQSNPSPLENISFFQQGDAVRQEEQGTPS